MPEKIPANSRATATLGVTVFYDTGDGDTVSVQLDCSPYGGRINVPRDAISNIRAPVQRAGAHVWHSSIESEFEVVMHDAEGGQYVLRNLQTRLIFTVPDNADVIPIAEWWALKAKDEVVEAAPDVEVIEEALAPAPTPGWEPPGMTRPVGADLDDEDVF